MVSSRVASTLFAALALAIGAYGRPSTTKVTHEKRDVVHGQWIKVSRAESDTPLTLRIGLKQRNLERAEEFINAISNPRSETYGQHWSAEKVADTFAPSFEAITETEQWLLGEGVASDHISRTAGRNWIKVTTTVGKAESLLDTAYNVYENEEGARLVACESYSVPAAIQGHIDLVAPTIQFDEREAIITTRGLKKRNEALPPKFKKLPHGHPKADSLKNCSEVTTPACLRAL
jgi:tripeptidyl-peptidase-1